MYDIQTPILPTMLPAGTVASLLREEDLPEMLALIQAHEHATSGELRESLEGLAEQLTTDSGRERSRCLVVRREGTVIAQLFIHHAINERFWAGVITDPSLADDLVSELWRDALAWAQIVAFDHARYAGDHRIRIDAGAHDADHASLTNLHALGFERVRAFIDMRIELASYQRPKLANDVSIRIAEVSDHAGADIHTVYDIIQTSFQDHFDWATRNFDEWVKVRTGSSHATLDNWTIASVDGQPVGATIHDGHLIDCAQSWYIANLGVLREGRRQGVAKALLHDSFSRAQEAGLTAVELEVDAQSPTGATYLYESVGMHRTQTWWAHQKHYEVAPKSLA